MGEPMLLMAKHSNGHSGGSIVPLQYAPAFILAGVRIIKEWGEFLKCSSISWLPI